MLGFIQAIHGTVTAPEPYSAYHIISVVIIVTVTILLCLLFRDASYKGFAAIILSFWAVMVVMEIVKQFYNSYLPDPEPHFEYAWGSFPFQLCSTPLYTLPIVAFSAKKKNALFDAFASYTAIFPFFGGLLVLINPSSVFNEFLYTNVQTMVHHGSQVITGVYIAVWCRKRYNIKFFAKGVYVFAAGIAIALVLNLAVHSFFKGYFNMFYISPYFYDDVPTFGDLFKDLPYALIASGYIAAVVLAGYLIYLAEKLSFSRFCEKKPSVNKA